MMKLCPTCKGSQRISLQRLVSKKHKLLFWSWESKEWEYTSVECLTCDGLGWVIEHEMERLVKEMAVIINRITRK